MATASSGLDGQAPEPSDDEDDDEWHYVLVEAHPLPTIDLSVSVLSKLAGPAVDEAFFAQMRRHYGKCVVMFRLATVLMVATFVTPAKVGYITTGLTACLAAASLHCSVLMMSWQLLVRMSSMQEFLFMSIINWLNWGVLASLFQDVRSFVCILQAWSFQLSILSDVMFRTVLSASKTSAMALPLLLVCVLMVFLRVVDVAASHYGSVRINNVNVQFVDVFLNLSTTLCLLVTRNIIRQSRAFAKANAKLITCTLLKTKLVLTRATKAQVRARLGPRLPTSPQSRASPGKPQGNSDSSPNESKNRAADTRAVTPSITPSDTVSLRPPINPRAPVSGSEAVPRGIRAHKTAKRSPLAAASAFISRDSTISYTMRAVMLTGSYDRTRPEIQQLRLVPTGLKLIDSRQTLVPRLSPTEDWSKVKIVSLQAMGLTGLALMVICTRSLDKPRLIPQHTQRILGIVSFLTSTVFIATSVVAMQTRLLLVLTRHFDVVMNLFQALTGALCLCAMVQWDQRCLVAITIGMWFVWVVLFDAITPCVRRHIGLTKRHAGVALVGVMMSLVRVVVSLTFDEDNAYVDSEITSFRVREGVHVELRTKSFFLNRMFPLTVWALRLLWELLWCPECELVFLKGSLEYYCPLVMLPVPKTRRVRPTLRMAGPVLQ